MRTAILPLDDRIREVSRLSALATEREEVQTLELVGLVLVGVLAALLTTYVKFRLGIPGHHIIFAVFPMALGFALVPRRFAGTTMSGAAMATTAVLGLGGAHVAGVGAQTSLLLTGPLLDLALRWGRGRHGWRLYAAFVAAGAMSNACAFLVRAGAKLLGSGGLGGGRAVDAWLPQAVWTYAIAGVVAGLVSAATWFQLRDRASDAA